MKETQSAQVPASIGAYHIERKIGSGGMGSVFLARHRTQGHRRAIKVMPKSLDVHDPTYSQRFFREARIAARLDHPNMVPVYECGAQGGYYYLVMDYVDGPNCRQLVERRGRLPWRRAVEIVRQVAEGLNYAASRGIIHRDVTPGNIIVSGDGLARIADLGLAREVSERPPRVTGGGTSIGTPHYMSPEQISDTGSVDHRSDIYSLGATLYHLVCGRVPFGGTTFEVMTKQVRHPLPSPRVHVPDLPADLCDVIRKMMAKGPHKRYQDYGELIRDLDHLLEGNPVSARGFRDSSMVGVSAVHRLHHDHHAGLEAAEIRRWLYVLLASMTLVTLGLLLFLLHA